MIREKYFIVLVTWSMICFTPAIKGMAQDSLKTLTLEQAIAATIAGNRDIRLSKLDQHIAEANYAQSNAIFLPQLNFSYTAITSNNPLNVFGFKLQQKAVTASDFNPGLLNHPSATPDFLTKLELQQPLLNMDLIYQRKAAAKQVESYAYTTEHTEAYLSFEAQKAYRQLQLSHQAVAVLEEALRTAKAIYAFTDNYYRQGMLQKPDLLNAQVRVSTVETQLSKAVSDVRNSSDYLSALMGQPTGVVYTADQFNINQGTFTDTLTTIPENRPDLLAMQKAIESADMMLRSDKMNFLPRLNAFVNYQWNDNRMWGFGSNAYLAGVQLSWDIFKGTRTRHSVEAKSLEKEKWNEMLARQKEQSTVELNKAYRQLYDARAEIRQQQVSVEQAAASLTILQNRYKQGLVNTTDVLMAAAQLSQQKFALAQAVFTSAVTDAYIRFLTSSSKK